MGCIAGVATVASLVKTPAVHHSGQGSSDSTTVVTQSSAALTKLATFLGGGHPNAPTVKSNTSKKSSTKTSKAMSVAHSSEERIEASSAKPEKVRIEIIAESMCPNCKEHSYLFEEHVMSKGVADILDINMNMMVIDGWNTMKDKGECEKGRWDCELGKYQLAGWSVDKGVTSTTQKWTYSRCLFKYQPTLIEHYVGSPEKLDSSSDFMLSKVSACADESGMDVGSIKAWVEEKGTKALFEGYQQVKEYDDPVWIKVNDHYIEYEADWLAAICVAYAAPETIDACQQATKLTAVVADSEETEKAAAAGKKTEATTTTTSKTKTLSWDEEEAAAQLSVAAKSKALFPVKNGKVNVYIVAEAFCPNCKEHSYYMDKLLMTPQGEKSGVRNIMNIYMEQMVLEGWDSEDDTGICEKGKYDCELSKYNLCSETIGNSVDNNDQHMWWDFVRCNYKHQDEILEMYKIKHVNAKLIGDITTTCAAESGVDYESISTCAKGQQGTELLKGSYKRVSSMSMPVWIYVQGQKFAMHEDWLSAVCSAYKGSDIPVECTGV